MLDFQFLFLIGSNPKMLFVFGVREFSLHDLLARTLEIIHLHKHLCERSKLDLFIWPPTHQQVQITVHARTHWELISKTGIYRRYHIPILCNKKINLYSDKNDKKMPVCMLFVTVYILSFATHAGLIQCQINWQFLIVSSHIF